MIPKPHIVPAGTVYVDAYVTQYDPKNSNDLGVSPVAGLLEAYDASVTLAIDGVSSSATLRLPKGTKINNRTYIEMYTIQGSAGVFRARSPQIGYGEYTTVQLEHAINELGDFIITDKIEEKTTLKKAVKKIFDYYSEKSSIWQKGHIDEPNDPDTSDEDSHIECVLEADYDNCLDVLNSIMEQYPYMMFTYDFSTTPWKLNIVNKPTTVEAEGRLSRNIKSAVVTLDDSEMANKIYMEGYKKNVDSNGYGVRKSNYSINKYGLIETVISGNEDDKDIAELTIKSYLRKHKKPNYSISINGIELSQMTGEKLDKLTLGKLMRIALPDYGETITENITGLSFSSVYKTPNAVTVTLNDEPDRVIKYIKKAQKSASGAGKAAKKISKEAIVKAEVSSDGKQVTLTYGDGRQVTFSKAVTLYKDAAHNAGWSGGVFRVTAYTRMNVGGSNVESQLADISTTLNGVFVQDGKEPTAESDTSYQLIVPVKVTHMDWGSYGDTGYHKDDFKVNAKPVYDNGMKAATVTGGWSGGTFTAWNIANSNNTTTTQIFDLTSRDVSWNGRSGTITVYANANGGETKLPTGKTLSVTAPIQGVSGRWSSGTFTAFNIYDQSTTFTTSIFDLTSQDVSWSGRVGTITLYANTAGGETKVATGKTLTVTAPEQTPAIILSSWSSGTITVTTNPAAASNRSITISDSRSADVSWSSGTGTIKVYAYTDDSEVRTDTKRTLTVSIPDISNVSMSTASPSGSSAGSISLSGSTAGTYKVISFSCGGKTFRIYFLLTA